MYFLSCFLKQIKGDQETQEETQEGREESAGEETKRELLEATACELKQNQLSMANTISNMKMTNPIKGLVSKRRKRFTADGFDLDLTCILYILYYVQI